MKNNSHLGNCALFGAVGGLIGLVCYYYWTSPLAKIGFAILCLLSLITLLSTFLFVVYAGVGCITAMIVGGLIGEPKWRIKKKKLIIPCELCGKQATDRHHIFSQTKWARRLYGVLIDDPRNIMYLCNSCHLNKVIPKMDEKEFCAKMGIKPRGKEYTLATHKKS